MSVLVTFLKVIKLREKMEEHTSPFSYCMAKRAAMKNVCTKDKRIISDPSHILEVQNLIVLTISKHAN